MHNYIGIIGKIVLDVINENIFKNCFRNCVKLILREIIILQFR